MAGDTLPTPKSYAVEQPTPIQLDTPTSAQVAAVGPQISASQYTQAAGDARALEQNMLEIKQENLQAMASFSQTAMDALKKAEEDKFADGYLQAMQGKTVAEIADEKPYFGLFGSGEAVRGARAAVATTKGHSLIKWVSDNQGTLINMSLDEQRKAVADYATSLDTGDAETDAMTAKGLMQIFPSVMDGLTRSSEAESQRQARINQADVLESHAQNLKTAGNLVAQGKMSPALYDMMEAQALDAARPMPGQSPESYRVAMQGNIMSLVKNGQFELATSLRTNILEHMLTPDEAFNLDEQMKQGQSKWLSNNPLSRDFTEFEASIPVNISAGRWSSKDALSAELDMANNRFMSETGSLTPLIDNKKRAQYLAAYEEDALRKQQAAEKVAAKVSASQNDEQVKRSIWLSGFASGSPSVMESSGLDSRTKMAFEQQEATKFFTEQDNTSGENLAKLSMNGYVLPAVKEKISSVLGVLKGGGTPSPDNIAQTQQALTKLMSTPYGMGAAEAYFGDNLDLALKMRDLDMSDRTNVQYIKEAAQATVKTIRPTTETTKAAADVVDSELQPGWWSRTFGDAEKYGIGIETQLKDEMKLQMASVMTQYPNMDTDSALKMSAQRAMRSKSFLGNRVISGPAARTLYRDINDKLSVKMRDPSDTRFNTALDTVIKGKVANDLGYKIGSINALNNGALYITVLRDDGTEQGIVSSGASIAAEINKNVAKVAAKAQADAQIQATFDIDNYGE